MADKLTPLERSRNMRRIRSKDTKPEITVRRLIHRMGFRFRLHRGDLPGKPDLVFPGRNKVIFVHGCFWHQHRDADCNIARKPKSRLEYWMPKLDRNVARDKSHRAALEESGWSVMTVWECEVASDLELPSRLRRFLT